MKTGPERTAPDQPEQTYEAPQLETVLSPDEVTREVHYAGEGSPDISSN